MLTKTMYFIRFINLNSNLLSALGIMYQYLGKIAEQFLPCHALCKYIIFEINVVVSKGKSLVNIKNIVAIDSTNFSNVYRRKTFRIQIKQEAQAFATTSYRFTMKSHKMCLKNTKNPLKE